MRCDTATNGARSDHTAVRVLDVDPDLAAGLDRPRREAAADRLLARSVGASKGTLPDKALHVTGPNGLGLLIVEGVIARELLLGDNVSVELLGAGDVVQGSRADDPTRLLRSTVRWTVIEPARFAVLDSAFAAELSAYPELTSALLGRTVERAHRVGVTHAIAQFTGIDRRLLALFWHLAERWGHVSHAGVEIPLRLPHRIVAQLIGARRPSVSTALTQLTSRGRLARRVDGGWVLYGEPVGTPTGEVRRVVRLRRRRVPIERDAVATPVDRAPRGSARA
jgi:CRP/FNR family cyclic AMP-dependent transcriptional regulator